MKGAAVDDSRSVGEAVYGLVERLYPLCRSITGNGVRQSLQIIGEQIPLRVVEVPSGTAVFDWTVPDEWNIRNAHIRDSGGRTIVDFAEHNLHLVSYSLPVRAHMSLQELRPHLHSLPEHPDWIPYRTSYYAESWGFCLRDRDLRVLREDRYEVVIDSSLTPGSLTYAECFIEGNSSKEVLVYTHTCHPSLANDNASGMALSTALAQRLIRVRPRLSYRFVFGPGTIGSIAWLAQNESNLERIRCGLVIGLVGDRGGLTYKCSRRGNHEIDRAARKVLGDYPDAKVERFTPYGYDERQFCSPGLDLPIGRLTRSANEAYAEYHTSADDLTLVGADALAESFAACVRILDVIEQNASFVNTTPKCEPQLGKRGLYRTAGGEDLPAREYALLWVLNLSDGDWSLLGISERSGLPFETVAQAAGELDAAGLLRRIEQKNEIAGGRQL